MKHLFDNVSNEVSKLTTRTYSTSFSLGIFFLNENIRSAIYSIYGFVRLADEIVDSFEGYNQKQLLEECKQQTYAALQNKISLNPIFNSFQQTVNKYNIDISLIDSFFHSMEMDLQKKQHNQQTYEEYILGSAEVVGLMCLYVFTEGNTTMYKDLNPYAMKLGAAFQKINFLRDMKDDYKILGRIYFPYISIENFTSSSKKQIEDDIKKDFDFALIGIKKLPPSSKHGVYLAYIYYKALFSKIQKMPPCKVLNERIRINNSHKISLMINSLLQSKLRLI